MGEADCGWLGGVERARRGAAGRVACLVLQRAVNEPARGESDIDNKDGEGDSAKISIKKKKKKR